MKVDNLILFLILEENLSSLSILAVELLYVIYGLHLIISIGTEKGFDKIQHPLTIKTQQIGDRRNIS